MKNKTIVNESILNSSESHNSLKTQETRGIEAVKFTINQQILREAWETSHRSTAEDWVAWIRKLSVSLLKESPSPALRACHSLAQVYTPLARELFNPALVSVWSEMEKKYQDNLIRNLEKAFMSPTIPVDILQILLNVAEFMERDDNALPIDIRKLSKLAEKWSCICKSSTLQGIRI